jgi:histidyl-tRNA synthetase
MEKVKGFRDFYPEDKRIVNYIFDTWKDIALKYGYEEVDSPILEQVSLYNKSGEEIPEQIYQFKDKGDRDLALRPETTPSIARMIKSNPNLKKPIKWFSISQCYRYERMQKGRSREFFQFNLDSLGNESMQADAEVIATLVQILKSLKLTKRDFYIRISNRKLLDDYYKEFKILQRKEVSRILDKKDKMSESEIKSELKKLKLNNEKIKALFSLFQIKDISEVKIESKGKNELEELFSILRKYKLQDYVQLDLSIMRGFDYYTGTVFEAFDKGNKFRAIAGGGRYDDLAGLPGIGYGFGDIVLRNYLEDKKLIPELNANVDVFIIPIKTTDKCISIAEELRNNNLKVAIDLQKRSISKNLEYANKSKIPYVLIIGDDELRKEKVKLKNMSSGEEKLTTVEKVIKEAKSL